MNQLIRFVQDTIDRHDKPTVHGFATDIGVSNSYLRNILSGKQKAGTKFFKQFSEYTGVTIDTLVEMQDTSLDDPPVDIGIHEIVLTDEYIAEVNQLLREYDDPDPLKDLARAFMKQLGIPELDEDGNEIDNE